ncbi:Ubiquinone/menaquinone biosynthesis C-methyltransferase UbiE [ANME-1 cluster archaeon GoMg2]|nr:Ubiquinone/menaquinone biosynthesis C-methyltransferase UbiE [ANME-1 cluster archaeon GoMg2]
MGKSKKTWYDNFYKQSDFKHRSEKQEYAYIKMLIKKLRIKEGAKVLDLGCGTGFYTHILDLAGMDVIGLDYSKEGVYKANETFKELEFVIADANRIPFKYNTFDLIFVKGLSLFNTSDFSSTKPLITSFLGYLTDGEWLIIALGSNLRGEQKKDSNWFNHRFDSVKQTLLRLDCSSVEIYYTDRILSPVFLGKFALNKFFTKILLFIALKTKLMGELICVIKKLSR